MGTGMKNCIPKFWERERESKKHSQLLGTGTGMKNSFPNFGNGNRRPVFPKMVGNGNSRSPLFQMRKTMLCWIFTQPTATESQEPPWIWSKSNWQNSILTNQPNHLEQHPILQSLIWGIACCAGANSLTLLLVYFHFKIPLSQSLSPISPSCNLLIQFPNPCFHECVFKN